jgi:hypothetical protein
MRGPHLKLLRMRCNVPDVHVPIFLQAAREGPCLIGHAECSEVVSFFNFRGM